MLDVVSSGMLDCINKGIINKDKGVFIVLYPVLVRPHLEYLCAVLVPTKQKRCGQAGEVPEKGYKDDQRTEKLQCEEWLRDPGLFSLEKRRLWGRYCQHVLVFKECLQRRWKLHFYKELY